MMVRLSRMEVLGMDGERFIEDVQALLDGRLLTCRAERRRERRVAIDRRRAAVEIRHLSLERCAEASRNANGRCVVRTNHTDDVVVAQRLSSVLQRGTNGLGRVSLSPCV